MEGGEQREVAKGPLDEVKSGETKKYEKANNYKVSTGILKFNCQHPNKLHQRWDTSGRPGPQALQIRLGREERDSPVQAAGSS